MHDLRSTELEVALLMNFGPVPKFKRFIMDNENKKFIGPIGEHRC